MKAQTRNRTLLLFQIKPELKPASKGRGFYSSIMVLLILFLGFTLKPNVAQAYNEGWSRTLHRFGVYGAFYGDPYPSLVGLNLAYNITDFFRINGGLGTVAASLGSGSFSAISVGGGAKFFIPSWEFSPVVGINYTSLIVNWSGVPSSGLTVNGATNGGSLYYTNLGVDWQTDSGFMLGFGYNLGLNTYLSNSGYFNLGWFF